MVTGRHVNYIRLFTDFKIMFVPSWQTCIYMQIRSVSRFTLLLVCTRLISLLSWFILLVLRSTLPHEIGKAREVFWRWHTTDLTVLLRASGYVWMTGRLVIGSGMGTIWENFPGKIFVGLEVGIIYFINKWVNRNRSNATNDRQTSLMLITPTPRTIKQTRKNILMNKSNNVLC